jgi:glycosyltransferase involved in cell wall biosynthesis
MHRKLLVITDTMEVGGTQRQIVELARHIDSSAYEVSLVYFRNRSTYVDDLREAGVNVTCIPKRWKVDPLFLYRLMRYLRQGEFELVHAFSFSGELWGWLANRIAGHARFISSVRSVYEWYSPLQWRIKRWITLGSAALVANSRAGADYAALRMGVRSSSVQVVHNGMWFPQSTDEVRKQRAARTDGEFRVLFVGRIVDHKNLPCLMRAFKSIVATLPHARLDIVGDGPDRAEMEALAASLGVAPRVAFHGEQADVVPYLAAADVFVCSSHREGLSNAIMEAMGAGLPVIASHVGGNSELVIHGETGLLFPPDDHESLAAMLIALAQDPARSRALGEAGHARVRRHHDPGRMAEELERIYERCLLDARPGSATSRADARARGRHGPFTSAGTIT